ncbi:RNA polymerase sigma factor [Candidatus Clostridium stratigraminis]|uniref:RNA polymerase sigma factor n=1 Tax=Candidatus Clostridium stratigraminis TaxID=3381661 RepID=A0ABW8T5L2_9CLOT
MIDEELIDRLKNNDKAAFKILYETYSEKIYKTAYLIVNDKSYAHDIVQEVFIKIYMNINTLLHNSAFSSWIYTITINCCMKHININSKTQLLYEEDDLIEISEEKSYFIPEDSFLENELHDEIMSYINKIPEVQKITIILFYYNDLTIKEIASAMKCSEGTVKARLSRGRKKLKILIDEKINENGNEVI